MGELEDWFWECIDSNDPNKLNGFFKANSLSVSTFFNASGLNGLHKACKEGNLDIIQILLAKNVEIDSVARKSYWTPLHFACSANHIDVVKYLLDQNPNLDLLSKDRKSAYD